MQLYSYTVIFFARLPIPGAFLTKHIVMQGIEWVLTLIANRPFINFLQGLYILCNKVLYFSNILYICSEMATSINIDIPKIA